MNALILTGTSLLDYETGKIDGFIDGCIISQPCNEDRHTQSKYLAVDSQYKRAIYSFGPSPYETGYARGVDLAAIYFKF